MKKGWFNAQIDRAASLLKKLELLDERNDWCKYPASLPGEVRSLSYVEEYNCYINARMFDLRLVDHSIMQFKMHDEDNVSYSYYQAPFEVPTYKEFLAEQLGVELAGSDDAGDLFYPEYELLIDTAGLRKGVTPIRYDYSPKLYEEGIHPAAHVHIGTANNIRLKARRRMTPLSFVLFILRQMYPDSWRRFLRHDNVALMCRAVREELELVDAAYVKSLDYYQLMLD